MQCRPEVERKASSPYGHSGEARIRMSAKCDKASSPYSHSDRGAEIRNPLGTAKEIRNPLGTAKSVVPV